MALQLQRKTVAIQLNCTFNIGRSKRTTNAYYLDGYLAEVNFIDGQALTPSSFGTYDTNGVWQPIKYSGTYGTNGFYLPFTNTASTATLGNDFSGNGNTWTVNNISLTAGSTYDSMNDSPTVTSATVANYALRLIRWIFRTPIHIQTATLVFTLQMYQVSCVQWYSGFPLENGIGKLKQRLALMPCLVLASSIRYYVVSSIYRGANSVYYYGVTATSNVAGTGSAYGATYGTADTIGIALDLSANDRNVLQEQRQPRRNFASVTVAWCEYCSSVLIWNWNGYVQYMNC